MSSTATVTQQKRGGSSAPSSGKRLSGPQVFGHFTAPAGSSPRTVTQAELASHCGIGSSSGKAWVSVHGQVFDITSFSQEHPGGSMIRLAAGRDATCLIESYHPEKSVTRVEHALLHKATYIGPLEVAKGGQAYTRPNDAFFLDVRARVDKLIYEKMGSFRYAYDNLGVIEAVATFLIYLYACYQVAFFGSWPWTLALGFLTGRMGFLMHMGNHLAISRNPTINKLVGWFMDLAGSNHVIWGYEHQVAHHGDPNQLGGDNDCAIGNPAIRLHPDIPWTPSQKWQHILVPVAITFGLFKWFVGDFSNYITKEVGSVRMAIDQRDWARLLAFKVWWIVAHVIVPVYFNGWGRGLIQLVVFMGIAGHYLENIFIVNHIQNGLVPPPTAHWADKQVMATANWCSRSLFWNWVSGGLNHQVEHHMFPSLSYYWYPHISPVVEETCKDHGLPYYDYQSFPEAWLDMIKYLRDLGKEDFVDKRGQKAAPALNKVHAA